jgi:hypothetical protein
MNRVMEVEPTCTKSFLLMSKTAEWVKQLRPWQSFGTFTYSWESSFESTRRCFEKFMRIEAHGVSYFYAMEENPGRNGHHVHALLYSPVEARRKLLWESWFNRYGRARIEAVKSSLDVSDYCAKYVCKERAWWNLKLVGNFTPAPLHLEG